MLLLLLLNQQESSHEVLINKLFLKTQQTKQAGLHPPKDMKENRTGQGERWEGTDPAHTTADGQAAAPRTVSNTQCLVPAVAMGRDGQKGLQKAGDHQPSMKQEDKPSKEQGTHQI